MSSGEAGERHLQHVEQAAPTVAVQIFSPHQRASSLVGKNNTEAKRFQNYSLMWLINHLRVTLAVLSADIWS